MLLKSVSLKIFTRGNLCARGSLRRVADAMDAIDEKRTAEKFANSFQSTFRRWYFCTSVTPVNTSKCSYHINSGWVSVHYAYRHWSCLFIVYWCPTWSRGTPFLPFPPLVHSLPYFWPYIFFHPVVCSSFLFFLSFFSSPNLSRRRLDVCHTYTHGVALVRI